MQSIRQNTAQTENLNFNSEEDSDVNEEEDQVCFSNFFLKQYSKYTMFSKIQASKNKFSYQEFSQQRKGLSHFSLIPTLMKMPKGSYSQQELIMFQKLKAKDTFSKFCEQHSKCQTSLEQITQQIKQIDELYDIQEKVCDNCVGTIYKAYEKASKIPRYIKILKKKGITEIEFAQFLTQIRILSKLSHPSIVQLIDIIQDQHFFYLISEYPKGDTLYSFINGNSYNQETIKIIMNQLLSAVNYLHQQGIVHRNLRMETIRLEGDKTNDTLKIKIVDFEGAVQIYRKPQIIPSFHCELMYAAPETVKEIVNPKSDIWSCGIILYLILTKKTPYIFKDAEQMTRQVLTGNYCKKSLSKVPLDIKIFLRSLLQVDWTKRISAHQALKCKWLDRNRQRTVFPSKSPKKHKILAR